MPIDPATPRARARVEMTNDIKDAARRQLVEVGSDGLSLRAVARELGVVSSAVYRYFPSRDDLLTALIVDAYDAVGAAAEVAALDPEGGIVERYARVCRAVRDWALAHPAEYALVYGSPVPGYRAPQDTVSPALRVTLAALGIIRDGVAAGEIDGRPGRPVAPSLQADFAGLRAGTGLDLSDEVVGRALLAWTGLLGHISYELFGHLHNGITDYDALFEHQLGRWTDLLRGA